MTRDPTDSLLSCNVEYLDEINTSLMIKSDARKTIRKLKDDSMLLLNYGKNSLHDKPIEKIWRNRNTNLLSVNVKNDTV